MFSSHGSGLQTRLANGGEMGYGDVKNVHIASKSKSSSGSRERAPESSTRRSSSKPYTETSSAPQGSSRRTSSSSSHRPSSSSHRPSSSSHRPSSSHSSHSSSSSRPEDGSHSRSSSTKGRTEDSASSSSHHRASSSSRRHEEQRPSAGIEEPSSPLPSGWSVAFSKSGRKYYLNEVDMTKTWEKPTCADPADSSGSARPVRSPSTGTSDHDCNNRRAPYSGDESGGRSTGVRMEVENGGPSTTVSLPRKTPAARTASRGAGAAPPALPARPRQEKPSEGSPSERSASRSSGSRDASRGSSGREESRPSGSRDASYSSSGWSASRPSGSRDASHISSSSSSSSRPRGDRDAEKRAVEQQLPGSGTGSESGEGSTSRSGRGAQRSEGVRSSTGQTAGASSRDAPTQPEAPAFDPALFFPAGMQLPKEAQEQFMKQMQAMPKQQQQMMQQQVMMQNQQQTATRRRGSRVTPGAAATVPTSGSPSSATQPGLYRGNPEDKNQGIYTSDLATGFGKGMGMLMKKMASAPNVKPPPRGYVGMSGGGFTTPGNFSADDLKKPKMKKPSSSGKKEKEGLGIRMLNGAMKKGLSLAGLGDCKLKVKKSKKGGYKWKGKADMSDSDNEESECEGEDEEAECEGEEAPEAEEGEEGAAGVEAPEEGEGEQEQQEGGATEWGKMPGLPMPSMCL